MTRAQAGRVAGALLAVGLALMPVGAAPVEPAAVSGCAPEQQLANLPPEEPDVRDPVFAVLLALLSHDRFGCLSGEMVAAEVQRSGRRSALPFAKIRHVTRAHSSHGWAGDALVTVALTAPLEEPIPYRLLSFYRPGDIRMAAALELREWHLGGVQVATPAGPPLALEDVHLFRFEQGRVDVDIDGWLDALMGSRLDDFAIRGVGTFRLDGRWWGVATGFNPKGQPRVGLMDFKTDEVAFPIPRRLWPVARQLRRQLEALYVPAASSAASGAALAGPR